MIAMARVAMWMPPDVTTKKGMRNAAPAERRVWHEGVVCILRFRQNRCGPAEREVGSSSGNSAVDAEMPRLSCGLYGHRERHWGLDLHRGKYPIIGDAGVSGHFGR